MFSNQSVMRIIIIWLLLTFIIALAILGVIAVTNYNKLSGGTCTTMGGVWIRDGNTYICYIQDHLGDEEVK